MAPKNGKPKKNGKNPAGNSPAPGTAVLRAENARLIERIRELEETLGAIRSGEVDAIIIPDGGEGKIYTLEGPDHPYRALVENIREGALTIAGDGTILYSNSRFAEMVSVPSDRIPGTSLAGYVCPEYYDRVVAALAGIRSRPCRSRVRLHQGKGSVPVFLSMSPLSNEEDTKISVIVTDRRRDEEQLRLQSRMLDSVGDAVIAVSPAGKILYWNDAATRTYGWEPGEVAGRDLVGIIVPEIMMEDSRKILKDLRQGGNWNGEYMVRHRDGHMFPVYVSDAPVFDDDGRLLAILGASHDITDRKLAEAAIARRNEELAAISEELRVSNEELTATAGELRQVNETLAASEASLRASEARFRELAEKAGSIILRFDTEGRITYFNEFAEKFFGFQRNEIIGRPGIGTIIPVTESGTGRDLGAMLKDMVINPDRYAENENENVKKNGERVWIRWTNNPVYKNDGTIREFTTIGNDITERKRAEEAIAKKNEDLANAYCELQKQEGKLKEALAEKEILLSEIHHRVKNNLSAFISLISLEGAYDSTPAGLAMRNDLQNRARSMALIHETLYRTRNFSHVDMQVYLSTLAEQVVGSYHSAPSTRVSVDARGIFLDLSRATPTGLIVNELLTNSLKYAWPPASDYTGIRTDPPMIGIRFEKDAAGYSLMVRDNGIGLPAEIDPAKTKTLGLKLVSFLARYQLQAEMNVHRDKGTEFIFHLNEKTVIP